MSNSKLRKLIEQGLKTAPRRRLDYPATADAAVLMAILLEDAKDPSFLLTKRTGSVSTHKGQISFPGGLREPQDESLLATALRETEEELGLGPDSFEVVGRFHDYLAVTEWRVAPFVSFASGPLQIEPNPDEVDRVLEVPIRFFQETEPEVKRAFRLGREISIYYYPYEDEMIWGLTARMIRDFVELVG